MFKTKGGGVKGFLNNVQKNCGSGGGGHPLSQRLFSNSFVFHPGLNCENNREMPTV